ncbi:MAG: tripartite tricarboxylate transporter substrate binding protein [Burkholderiales bacterium]|nr:tripartite tricarboxylate transporter substrate binding protein [Burkholderiales bacterium]
MRPFAAMRAPGPSRLLACAALLALAATAAAQEWPERAVRVIVSTAVGSTPDLVARMVAERLARRFERAFYVENLTGGGGLIASGAAARAAPDGYTTYFAGVGVWASDRYLYKSLPYDPDRSFAPVAILYDSSAFAIGVHPALPAKSVGELVALAKAQPGKLSYGTQRVGVIPLFGQWFNKVAGTEMTAIAYNALSQMMQDVVAGTTQLLFYSVNVLEPLHRTGKLRILAVGNRARFPPLPEVPTVAETLPGFEVTGLGILAAPAATPGEVVRRLNAAIAPIVREPEYVRRLHSQGLTIDTGAGTPQEIAAFLRRQRENWARIMQGTGVRPE